MKTLTSPFSFALPNSRPAKLDDLCKREGHFVMKEIWKDIPGYEGYYQASNFGRIKSLFRLVKRSRGAGFQKKKEQILSPLLNKHNGYSTVQLCMNGIVNRHFIHRLIALVFIGKSNLPVDHINHKKSDNKLSNLRYCTTRENICSRRIKSKTGYIGVCENKNTRYKYRARIRINGKLIHLGNFHSAKEAGKAYQQAMSNLEKTIEG